MKDSQFNLGILAAKGVGMPQNLEESYKWFALVAKTGDKDAATKRDEIANALRPEQLERARAAARTLEAEDAGLRRPIRSRSRSPGRRATHTTASIDMKKAVQNIQLILNKNGYDAGDPDGVMGGKTKAAIAAFQKRQQHEADRRSRREAGSQRCLRTQIDGAIGRWHPDRIGLPHNPP